MPVIISKKREQTFITLRKAVVKKLKRGGLRIAITDRCRLVWSASPGDKQPHHFPLLDDRS